MSVPPPTVLLLQIRDLELPERQEQECFVQFSGLPRERFVFWNLLERPEIDLAACVGAGAVIVGGAGAHSVTAKHPFTAPLARLVRQLVAAEMPLFGSCFGHQFIAQALGGRVITDAARSEIGTFEVELTPAGLADPWLAGLPSRFTAQFGHHDRVVELPPGAVELAVSDLCPHQAFRLAGTRVYGAQFHVELDAGRMIERAGAYRDGYLPDPEALDRLRRSLRPSPVASGLLRRFLALAGVTG